MLRLVSFAKILLTGFCCFFSILFVLFLFVLPRLKRKIKASHDEVLDIKKRLIENGNTSNGGKFAKLLLGEMLTNPKILKTLILVVLSILTKGKVLLPKLLKK